MQRLKTKRSKRSNIDEKYFGSEPILSSDNQSIDFINFYNWHNYFHTTDDAKSFVIGYLKKIKADKDLIKKVTKVDPDKLRITGWHCRNLLLGGSLPKGLENDIMIRVNLLVKDINLSHETEEEKPVVSIQDRIKDRTIDLIGSLEQEIDKFIENKSYEFDSAQWFREQAVKPMIAKRISDYYIPLYNQIIDAIKGEDEQLNEYYHRWKKPELKKYAEFVKNIISTADIFTVAAKISRLPRKKKIKPAALVVKNLKYKEKDDETSIASIVPSTIVGSDQLWTYNTRTRTLSVYNSLGPVGLSVKGTTVTGYDENTSITKKVRKPQETLTRVLEGGKLVLRKIMDEINCKSKKANGRINNHTILLRAIK